MSDMPILLSYLPKHRDQANVLLNTTRASYEPNAIIAALSPRIFDIPERMKTALMQYMGVIVPHCTAYFSVPINTGTPNILINKKKCNLHIMEKRNSFRNCFYPGVYSYLFIVVTSYLIKSSLPQYLFSYYLIKCSSPHYLSLTSRHFSRSYGKHIGMWWIEAFGDPYSSGQKASRACQ